MSEWTTTDIKCLHDLLREGASFADISRIVKRTRSAVANATHKIVAQQLLHHSPTEVARNYGIPLRDLRALVGANKYYVPIEVPGDHSIPMSILMIGGLIVACGMARFGHVLCHSPLLA